MNELIALSLLGTHLRNPQSPSAAEKPPETAWEKHDFSPPPTILIDASYWQNATGRPWQRMLGNAVWGSSPTMRNRGGESGNGDDNQENILFITP